MNCIIIEDEPHAAEHLIFLLSKCNKNINVEIVLDSVRTATAWLKNNTTELIFMDIQLGDDQSFSIFDNVEVQIPVIFTTSYNEYAIKAFDVNSISYLLKPIDLKELKSALDKYETLNPSFQNYIKLNSLNQSFQKRFLVYYGTDLISINAEEIAFFYVQGKHLFIIHQNGDQYLFDSTLEALEIRLNPDVFFRINRQYILSFNAIKSMQNHTRGRVIIETNPICKDELVVSIERANEFKNWLNR